MLSSVAIGFMLGAGVAAWVYTQIMRRTGGNTQQAAIVAFLAGLMGFILVVTTMSLIDSVL